MKGIVLGDRYKEKDAYDIFTIVSECGEKPSDVSKKFKSCMEQKYISKGLDVIEDRFKSIYSSGLAWVADFLQPTDSTARDRKIAEVFVKMRGFLDGLNE